MERIEAEMKECDAAIQACIRDRIGLASAAEYFAQCGGVANVNVFSPPLPNGMIDAAEFRGRMLSEMAIERQSFNQNWGRQEMVEVELKALVNRRWALLMQLVVVDGAGFKAELSPLLQRKVKLLLDHRMLLAERIMQLKRDPEHLAWLNAAAGQLQTLIATLAQHHSHSMRNQDSAAQTTIIRQSLLQDTALSAYFPSLFVEIPKDLVSNEKVLAFLAGLSAGVERDRVKALAEEASPSQKISAAAARIQATILRVQLCLPSLQMGAASTHLLPLRHNQDLHDHFPSLLEKIPESFASSGDLSLFLVELSGAVERDRVNAEEG